MKKVSVLIATHNRRELVNRAIDSALAQNGCAIQVVVVDDCSTDGTLDFLREEYGSRISLLSTEKNSGYGAVCNLGFSHCDGDFIALLGDDDYWTDTSKLRAQIDLADEQPNVGLVGTWWTEYDENGYGHTRTPVAPQSKYLLAERMLLAGGLIGGSTALVRREAWESVNGMDSRHPRGVDSDFFRRVIFRGYSVRILPVVLAAVDVGHAHGRMTAREDPRAHLSHLLSQGRTVMKHFPRFLLHPRALIHRILKIVRDSSRLIAALSRPRKADSTV